MFSKGSIVLHVRVPPNMKLVCVANKNFRYDIKLETFPSGGGFDLEEMWYEEKFIIFHEINISWTRVTQLCKAYKLYELKEFNKQMTHIKKLKKKLPRRINYASKM